MKLSMTYVGIIVAVAGTLLVQFGFTEGCSSEITSKLLSLLPVAGGGALAGYGRYRIGDINAFGVKK